MPRCEIQLLVPHPDRPALLIERDGPTRLPSAGAVEGEYSLPKVLAAIEARLGSMPRSCASHK